MTFDNLLLSPNIILYFFGLIFAMICTQTKNRQKMMFFKFLGDYSNATYSILMGGLSGGLAGFIAGTGGLTQALTPDKHLSKTLWPRIIGASILSIMSIYFSYKAPADLLPIAAVVGCRFMELNRNPERIRLAYYLSGFLWILYFYLLGIYLLIETSTIMNIMFLIGLLRHRPKPPIDLI